MRNKLKSKEERVVTQKERQLLGIIMLHDDFGQQLIDSVDVGYRFGQAKHKLMFDALVKLKGDGEPVDVVTLSEHLEKNGTLGDAGGLEYLADVVKATPALTQAGVNVLAMKFS